MATETLVACCQIAPDVTDPRGNAELAREAIGDAVANGAQIVVLPELVTSGYVFSSADEVQAAAISADDELLQGWAREAARGHAVVIGGFCERAPDGRVFNSSALIDADGVRAVYRKLHLWNEESEWFSAGEERAPVIETRYGRIGLGICYDLEFPELTRGLALGGADLIAMPTNWPHHPHPPDGRPVLHSLAAITAWVSKVFVAVCDRCGAERGVEFEGGSVIAGPDGALRAGPIADRATHTIYARCELERARNKRTSARNDAFADRRAEMYSNALVESLEMKV
jgi:5-aminopentanamidase